MNNVRSPVSNRRRWLPWAAAFLVLAPAAAAQDSDEKEDGPKGGKAEVVDDKTAKQLLKDEKAALSSREPRLRKESLERLGKYSNELLVKAFEGALTDRDPQVVAAAIGGIANQPGEQASVALFRLLRNKRLMEDDTRAMEVVQALGRTGWGKRGYGILRDLFGDGSPKVKKEVLRAFTAQKEVQAFSLFVDNLDEPRPKNVNSPTNPPAAYWKARYKEWTFIKREVRLGLEAVTGRKFENAKEAMEWAKTREARKMKVRYKAGS